MDAIDNDNDDNKRVNKSHKKQTQILYKSEASNQTLAQHSDIGIVNRGREGELSSMCQPGVRQRGRGIYIYMYRER